MPGGEPSGVPWYPDPIEWVTSRKDLETFRDVFGSLDSLVPDDRNEINKYSNSTNEKDCL